jgi:hypothetical protein
MAQGMEESPVADPPLLLDQLVMHDGEVGGCTAEADPSELEPETQRFPEGRPLWRSESFIPRHSRSKRQGVDKIISQKL